MGMDSAKLSARARQPGHDRTFQASEDNFVAAPREIHLPQDWVVEGHPRALSKIILGRWGVVPEACTTYRRTGRKIFFEVKKQGPAGNADERACKHRTVQL